MTASKAAKKATWLWCVYTNMRVDDNDISPIDLYMDNQDTIALTSTEGIKHSKHIDVHFHHVHDLQQQDIISINNISSTEMAADGLTKMLHTDVFNHFLSLININGDVDDRE